MVVNGIGVHWDEVRCVAGRGGPLSPWMQQAEDY